MQIGYIEPFSRAWGRMKAALFSPFSLSKWFAVGFTAFLAGLMDGHGGGSGGSDSKRGGVDSFDEFLELPGRAWGWLMDNPEWLMLIVAGLLLIIGLLVVLTWLSSRGTFMFLDNVVHDRAEVVNPWKEYRVEGNSLFLWRLGFGVFCVMIVIAFVVIFFVTASQVYADSYDSGIPILLIIGMGLLFLLVVIIFAYISLFLKDFVAPLMYRYRETATQAWGRFLPVLKEYPFHFIFYGIFMFVMVILVVIGIIFAAVMTCCVGFVVLVIPYIGTVATLPAWYTFRAFSLEFLAQFGEGFNVFPPAPSEAAPISSV